MKSTQVYKYPASYAEEHGELALYRASSHANVACKEAIEAAITKHYHDNILHRNAVSEVTDQYGYERVLYVLANTVQQKDWDHRFSYANRVWAKTIPIPHDINAFHENRNLRYVINSHSGLLDLFLTQARQITEQKG